MSNTDGLLFDNDPRTRTYTGAFDFPPEDVGGGTGGGNDSNDGNNGGGSSPGPGDGPNTNPGNGEGGTTLSGINGFMQDRVDTINDTPNPFPVENIKGPAVGENISSVMYDTSIPDIRASAIPVGNAVYLINNKRPGISTKIEKDGVLLLTMAETFERLDSLTANTLYNLTMQYSIFLTGVPDFMSQYSGPKKSFSFTTNERSSLNTWYNSEDLVLYDHAPSKESLDEFLTTNTGSNFYSIVVETEDKKRNAYIISTSTESASVFGDLFVLNDGITQFAEGITGIILGPEGIVESFPDNSSILNLGLLSDLGGIIIALEVPFENKTYSQTPSGMIVPSNVLPFNKYKITFDGEVIQNNMDSSQFPYFITGLRAKSTHTVSVEQISPMGIVSGGEVTIMTPSTAVDDFENEYRTFPTTGTWETSTLRKYRGSRSFASPKAGDNTQSIALISIDVVEECELTLMSYTSSESSYDKLEARIDDNLWFTESGDAVWKLRSKIILPGMHTLKLNYIKDASNSHGDDKAYIDMLTIKPTGGTV